MFCGGLEKIIGSWPFRKNREGLGDSNSIPVAQVIFTEGSLSPPDSVRKHCLAGELGVKPEGQVATPDANLHGPSDVFPTSLKRVANSEIS